MFLKPTFFFSVYSEQKDSDSEHKVSVVIDSTLPEYVHDGAQVWDASAPLNCPEVHC